MSQYLMISNQTSGNISAYIQWACGFNEHEGQSASPQGKINNFNSKKNIQIILQTLLRGAKNSIKKLFRCPLSLLFAN